MAKHIGSSEDELILVARKHLKSMWMKLFCVQQVLIDPYVRIGLFSVSPTLVKAQLVEIKKWFRNPWLLKLFADQIPDEKNYARNTANFLTLYRDPSKSVQGEQITALGRGAHVAGLSVDVAVVDDIEDDKTTTTPEQMQKTRDWWGYIHNVLMSGGLMKVSGTFYHYNDIYNVMIRKQQFSRDHIHRMPGIVDEKIIYPFFTKEWYAKLKKVQSPYIFSCQVMLNPTPQEDMPFPPPQPIFEELPKDESGYQFYIGIDPAAKAKSTSDDNGLVVVAKNKINQIFVVEAIGMRKPHEEIIDWLIEKTMQYLPYKVAIELGNFEQGLNYILADKKSQYELVNNCKVPIRIDPISTGSMLKKSTRMANAIGPWVRTGKLFIKSTCTQLIEQMDTYSGRGDEKDDIIDALSMIFMSINNYNYSYQTRMDNLPGSHVGRCFYDLYRDDEEYKWKEEFSA
jgi:predicted phage terminase large subunit-like protein